MLIITNKAASKEISGDERLIICCKQAFFRSIDTKSPDSLRKDVHVHSRAVQFVSSQGLHNPQATLAGTTDSTPHPNDTWTTPPHCTTCPPPPTQQPHMDDSPCPLPTSCWHHPTTALQAAQLWPHPKCPVVCHAALTPGASAAQGNWRMEETLRGVEVRKVEEIASGWEPTGCNLICCKPPIRWP